MNLVITNVLIFPFLVYFWIPQSFRNRSFEVRAWEWATFTPEAICAIQIEQFCFFEAPSGSFCCVVIFPLYIAEVEEVYL